MKKEEIKSQNKSAVKVAADWWVNKISVTTPDKFNMGEDGYESYMCLILAMNNSLQNTPKEEKTEKLRAKLITVISQRLEKHGSCTLRTDYHPEGELYEIANELGISESCFPWKTCMDISNEKVEVKCGYGAPFETIYPVDEHTN